MELLVVLSLSNRNSFNLSSMKNTFLLLVFFFNLLPCFEKGSISFSGPVRVSAQTVGEELSPVAVCGHNEYTDIQTLANCMKEVLVCREMVNCDTNAIVEIIECSTMIEEIPGCQEWPDEPCSSCDCDPTLYGCGGVGTSPSTNPGLPSNDRIVVGRDGGVYHDVTIRFTLALGDAADEGCRLAAEGESRFPDNPQALQAWKTAVFYEMVHHMAPWDIKQPGRGYSDDELGNPMSIYNGSIMRNDSYGNMVYGYIAASLGLSMDFVTSAAGMQQVFGSGAGAPDWSNMSGFFDEADDTMNIEIGYGKFAGCP
jgi:hypothetical protein